MTDFASDSVTDNGLSGRAYLGFAAAFLFLPGACVLLSSFLYRSWRARYPVSATQLNRLGFVIFSVQFLIVLVLWRSQHSSSPQVPTTSVSSAVPLVSPQATAPPAEQPVQGAFVTLVDKPFRLWQPSSWRLGDPPALGFDAEVHEGHDRLMVQLSAIPLVDLPPQMRTPDAVIASWRTAVDAKTTDCHPLPPVACVMLGMPTELFCVDVTLKPELGGRRIRHGTAVVSYGGWLCQFTISALPSFAEQMGPEGLQEIVKWVQATESPPPPILAAPSPGGPEGKTGDRPAQLSVPKSGPDVQPFFGITPDQELLNNLLLSAHALSQSPEHVNSVREGLRLLRTNGVSAEVKTIVDSCQKHLKEIVAVEGRIAARIKQAEAESTQAGASGGLQGGLEAASLLANADVQSGGQIGTDPLMLMIAGAVGGAIRANQMTAAVDEAARRDIRALREEQKDIAASMMQEIAAVRESQRLLAAPAEFNLEADDFEALAALPISEADLGLLMKSLEKRAFAWNCMVCAVARETCDTDKQLALIDKAIAEWPSCIGTNCQVYAGLWNLKCEALLFGGNAVAAIDAADKAISCYANSPLMFSNRALARITAKQFKEAIDDARAAQRLAPDEMAYRYVEAMGHAMAGDAKGTARALQAACDRGWSDVTSVTTGDMFAGVRESPEVAEVLKLKWSWSTKSGLVAGDVFLKNESAYALTNVVLTPGGAKGSTSLQADRIGPGETHHWEWVHTSAVEESNANLRCDQVK